MFKNLLSKLVYKPTKLMLVAALLLTSAYNVSAYDVTTTTTWDVAYFTSNPTPSFGTWNSSTNTLTMNQNIEVKNNTTVFTITDGITVLFGETHGIYVNAGTSFIVDGGVTLSYNSSTGNFWAGIFATGDVNESQFNLGSAANIPAEYETRNASTVYNDNQTYVWINGVTLERMRFGLQSDGGAILRVENSVFTDCETSVSLLNYTQAFSVSIVNGLEWRNASYISDCDFNWWSVVPYPKTGGGTISNFATYVAINLFQVHGIHVQGIDIKNNSTSFFSTVCGQRGRGIAVGNASISIHSSGTPTYSDPASGGNGCVSYSGNDNTITDTDLGIEIIENTTPVPDQRINATFQDIRFGNLPYGIYVNNSYRILVKDCQFNMEYIDTYMSTSSYAPCPEPPTGIFAGTVEQLMIYNNTFNGRPLTRVPSSVMFVHLRDCGKKDNKVFQNTFTVSSPNISNATIFRGVELSNENSKVEVLCNTFNAMHTAIEVASGSTINNVWENKRTGGALANTFNGSLDKDLKNLSTTLIDYYEKSLNFVPYKKLGSWKNVDASTEDDCSPFPCTEWPIGVGFYPVKEKTIGYTAYPNPVSSGSLYIDFEEEFTGDIVLVDLLGRTVARQSLTYTTNAEVPTQYLAEGVYVLMVQTQSGEVSSQKIILQK